MNLFFNEEINVFDFVGGKDTWLIVKKSVTFFNLLDKVHEELRTTKTI